mmetsp:Transcript_19141/g.43512  ORF Transcript_19141/g.43512 Transcript_19141/m.43512 type:complete len:227 (+) Transcript_19141:300-980(+)
MSPSAKALGPFRMAKELSNVIEPKAKSRANFWGAIGSIGRKEKDIERRKTPAKKTPPNWASLAGDVASAVSPEMPDVTFPAPAAAAALTDPAAAAAFSLATCALAAPAALASESFCWLLPCRSLAICCAALPFSEIAEVAFVAPSVTFPRPFSSSFCQPFACSAHSPDLAFSAAWLIPCRASLVASENCCFARLAAALAQEAHCGASPLSASGSSDVLASACGTTS